MGLVWSVPISSKENDTGWTNGGGEHIIVGGSKTVFEEEFYDVSGGRSSLPKFMPIAFFRRASRF